MTTCQNGIQSLKIKCDQPKFFLDSETQMWLCFHCWWDWIWEDMQNDLKVMGLKVPADNRPEKMQK